MATTGISQRVNECPKASYLNKHVRDKICASEARKWEDLGRELLDDDDMPALAARTHNMNEKQCCSEMFKLWLERQPEASWRQLIAALHVLKLNRLAGDIENLLIHSPKQSMVQCNQPQNQEDVTDDEVECVERQFSDFVITELRKVYREVVKKIMHIFKEKKIDIEELITVLRFDDVRSVFSTDDVFSTITTESELFKHISKYCKSIYDYQVLDDLVQTSGCSEAIGELNGFTELRRNSILAQVDLISGHGGFLHPDDFMPGTYKFVIEYVGGKCTIETKEMVQGIVQQSVRLKNGTLIFKGVDAGSILFIYQISKVVKDYLLQYEFTEQDLAFLEGNKIISLKVDDVWIMHSSQLYKVKSHEKTAHYMRSYADYNIDDELPEPVFFKLESISLKSDPDQDGYSDEDSSIEGDEVELNLFAPPHDTWYHGLISRPLALSRILDNNQFGCYLIRDSETRPGEYTLSFLSMSGIVQHFKINASCGDYYIGGRQFNCLEDLIGFYTNCSCILENEYLMYPVSPPSYVPLYVLLRATGSHTRDQNSDEINIEADEIFALKNRLNDNWGWATSQLSGESGLIPLKIMEECEESWGALLCGRAYSLAVLTADGVQRFLINRDSCFYLFGGRRFGSVEDVIKRYLKEEIIVGQKLKAPLPPLKDKELKRNTSSCRNSSHSLIVSRGDDPKNKSGLLNVKKDKKILKLKVFAKWKKKQYCVLMWEDQHLRIYDNAQSHRAKGLLDLSHCQILDVHSSIKPQCFVVVQRYLTEQNYYYLQSDSEDTIREWHSAIRSSIAQSSLENKRAAMFDSVQELWSLTIHVKDCQLAKPCPLYFSTVSIDDIPVACTKKTSQIPTSFDEQFKFMDLPRDHIKTLSVSVSGITKSKLKASSVQEKIGKMTINFASLPECQEYDKWHQLIPVTGKSTTSKGTLRLIVIFNHEVILPSREYSGLKELLLREEVDLLEILVKVCKDHHAELASRLVQIFLETNNIINKLIKCNQAVIDRETKQGTLFRASSLATMLMDQYMKLKCGDYLHHVLHGVIKEVEELNHSDSDGLEKHIEHFINLTINSIFASAAQCPLPLRYIFHCLQHDVGVKWPDDDVCKTRTVGGFLFLRLICPALLKPQLFDLMTDSFSPNAERTLKLIAKYLQNLANQVEFKAKEQYMIVLNDHLKDNMEKMRKFIDTLSSVPIRPHPPTYISYEPGRDLAFVYRIFMKYEEELKKRLSDPSTKDEISSLLTVMKNIRKVEEKYLKKLSNKEK